jgi:hypothetical protein
MCSVRRYCVSSASISRDQCFSTQDGTASVRPHLSAGALHQRFRTVLDTVPLQGGTKVHIDRWACNLGLTINLTGMGLHRIQVSTDKLISKAYFGNTRRTHLERLPIMPTHARSQVLRRCATANRAQGRRVDKRRPIAPVKLHMMLLCTSVQTAVLGVVSLWQSTVALPYYGAG